MKILSSSIRPTVFQNLKLCVCLIFCVLTRKWSDWRHKTGPGNQFGFSVTGSAAVCCFLQTHRSKCQTSKWLSKRESLFPNSPNLRPKVSHLHIYSQQSMFALGFSFLIPEKHMLMGFYCLRSRKTRNGFWSPGWLTGCVSSSWRCCLYWAPLESSWWAILTRHRLSLSLEISKNTCPKSHPGTSQAEIC